MLIDLRSDTVTRPSKEMLNAMQNANVGDDVFAEDPTVIELEKKLANMFGMQAGLFCPSGTMTNQIAIKVHTQPGDELICDATAHIYNYETGGISFNSGVQAKLLNGKAGKISAQEVDEAIQPNYDWLTKTSLVSIENTCNRAGGSYYTINEMEAIADVCTRHQLKYHLDGARIFNAIIKLTDNHAQPEIEKTAAKMGSLFSSVSVCLSKGLGAPVGSVLLGDAAFIKQARRVRKVFGGGMRQAGYLAAAGIFALENNILRLKDDHKRAGQLAECLAKQQYIESILPVESNIVIFNLKSGITAADFVNKLAEQSIKVAAFGKQTVRMVTHLDFTDAMLNKTVDVLSKIR
jgi:threonine aldolase